jgi:release factor glutamine methyltransferase
MQVKDYIKQNAQKLAEHLGCDLQEAIREIRILCAKAWGVDYGWLIAHAHDSIDIYPLGSLEAFIRRRSEGEPVAYILGYREFFGLSLITTPDTLIPRPDTETLVEFALAKIPQQASFSILDLGTGTGAIALAIAHQRPYCKVTAVDQSVAAIEVAKKNARLLGLSSVECHKSDWFSALKGRKFDLIVSNPPYIANNDPHLQQGDLRFEPMNALASGEDGLLDIRQIIAQAIKYLHPKGWLLLEHGYDQGKKVAALFEATGFYSIEQAQDLSGHIRVTGAQSF